MTDPRDPQYPQYQAFPGAAPYPQPVPPTRGPGLSDRLGDRAIRRPDPRLGVSLAGAGIGLAVLGVLIWGGDYLGGSNGGGGGGGGDSSSRRLLGAGLALVVVVAGYALAVSRRRGPLATAGVVASALGVPVLLGFLTFDTAPSGQSGLPVSLDAIVLVSVLAWLLSYLVVPGARGHSFYLGLAAITIWPYVLDKAEPGTFSVITFVRVFVGSQGLFGGGVGPVPDWTTVAVISLMFGLGYYLVAFTLDHVGRSGPGAALAVAGFLATAGGIAAAAVNLPAIGTGILLIVLGLILARFGARGGRRFTTWTWSAGVALGVTVIIAKLTGNNSAAAGVALIASGGVVVLIGHVLAGALHESDDLMPATPAVPAMGAARMGPDRG
jgi:hypothetical protein